MLSSDIMPSRLIRARYKTIDILEHLKEAQVGLLTFAGESYVVSPITDDSHTIKHLVKELSPSIMPVPGYQLNIALMHAQQLLRQSHIKKGNVILLTAGPVSEDSINRAHKLHEDGITVSVLALGSEQGAPISHQSGDYMKDQHGNIIMSQRDTQRLQRLAKAGGGHYANFTTTDDDIEQLLPTQTISRTHSNESEKSDTIVDWENQGRLLLYPLLIIALLCFRRGWLTEVLP